MQGKCDVDAFFRHKPCIHHMALQTMHHVNDAVWNVLYLFYFLALPFYNPFIYRMVILLKYCRFASKTLIYSQIQVFDLNLGCVFTRFRYPTTAVEHCLRVPVFQPFLLLWRFHEHDEHMHRSQLESNDQQSSFR